MSRPSFIGMDRRIELVWLDAVASKAAAGEPRDAVHRWLVDELLCGLGGQGPRSARAKTATVLLRTWYPQEIAAARLRELALAALSDADPTERLALHWSMLLCAYPFFGEVARHVGRLTQLQGQASIDDVIRRVAEQYGDRSTLPRAVQRVVSSAACWGAVKVKACTVRRVAPITVGARVAVVLANALLASREGGSASIDALLRDAAAFPFDWSVTAGELHADGGLQVDHLGLDEVHVRVRSAV